MRATTEWVDRGRIVLHPLNDNVMSDASKEKLIENVRATDEIPPLIVRSLEVSEEYTAEHEAGKLQMLDGEQRFSITEPDGEFPRQEVEVKIWRGITDARALQILASFNNLRGKSDPKRRRKLIQALTAYEDDYDVLATVLPETAETIARYVDEDTRAAVSDAQERAAAVSKQEPVTVFCLPGQRRQIEAAIQAWLGQHGAEVTECREGAALASICVDYTGVSV